MVTVGETLYNARTAKKLTLEQAERATKIRAKFLDALEKNEFGSLPPGTFTKGFIKNYAAFLGLPVEETLAFYRRQVNEEKAVLPKKPDFDHHLKLTPSLVTAIAVGFLLFLFFGYLFFSYWQFAGSPILIVNSPANNTVVNTETVAVSGKTDPQAQLTINGQAVSVDENGNFDTKVTLQPGINTITITALNRFKRQSTIVRNLRLEK